MKEDEENNNMMRFINDLIQTSLTLLEELNFCSLAMKPKDPVSPPRSIIITFLDYRVKELVIQEAWKHRGGVTFKEKKIFFDQDNTSDIQKKCNMIKQLKEKNIKAQSPFLAKLKIHLESRTNNFATLADATTTLEEMGIQVQLDKRERLQVELLRNSWNATTSNRKNLMTNADLKSFLHGKNVTTNETTLDCE